MQDDGSTEQYSTGHCQKLSVETAAAVNELRNTAVYQQHSAGQRSYQSHTYANLLAVSVLGGDVILKM
ncbi:hypothetical protein ES703_23010 [subsurface metagenome]